MRHLQRIPIALCLVLGLLASPAASQLGSIGLYATPDCGSCDLTIAAGEISVLYVVGKSTFGEDFSGAELRVVGLPAGWSAVAIPNPQANIALGDPFGAGANIAFPVCPRGTCILLYTVYVNAPTAVSDVTLEVVQHAQPSNPTFSCPRLVFNCCGSCDIWGCSTGGQMFVNSSRSCNVAVRASTWSKVKDLYRD